MKDSIKKNKEINDLKNYDIYKSFIKDLSKILRSSNLQNIEFKEGDLSIKIEKALESTQPIESNNTTLPLRETSKIKTIPISASSIKKEEDEEYTPNENDLLSPMVGIAYLAPDPDSDNFIEVGSAVKKGDVILILEAMKIFNNITAHKDGTITKIHINNFDTVEYDQPLVTIK